MYRASTAICGGASVGHQGVCEVAITAVSLSLLRSLIQGFLLVRLRAWLSGPYLVLVCVPLKEDCQAVQHRGGNEGRRGQLVGQGVDL